MLVNIDYKAEFKLKKKLRKIRNLGNVYLLVLFRYEQNRCAGRTEQHLTQVQ